MEKVEEDRITFLRTQKLTHYRVVQYNCLKLKVLCMEKNFCVQISSLIETLSRLPSIKYAIRTGTLSKRWRYLWTSVHTLILTHTDPKSLSDFVSFVDKTLTQCRLLKLKKFKMYTVCRSRFESQFNEWIRYALIRNVEELDLTVWYNANIKFPLDQKVFTSSCLTDLKLAGCAFNPTGAIRWVLDITSKSVKEVVILGYFNHEDEYGDNDDIIEINAPNILSLKIQDWLYLWKVLLLNVSSVVEANLNYRMLGYKERTREEAEEEMLKGYILNLHHVKELIIGVFCTRVLARLEAKGFVLPSSIKFTCHLYDGDSDSVKIGGREVLLINDPNGNKVD
ncbi:hypothetical protein LXL04_027364 [Taraxacum kok-saghyz]